MAMLFSLKYTLDYLLYQNNKTDEPQNPLQGRAWDRNVDVL